MFDTCLQDTPGIFDWRIGVSVTLKHLYGSNLDASLFKNILKRQNREEAKFLAATDEAV